MLCAMCKRSFGFECNQEKDGLGVFVIDENGDLDTIEEFASNSGFEWFFSDEYAGNSDVILCATCASDVFNKGNILHAIVGPYKVSFHFAKHVAHLDTPDKFDKLEVDYPDESEELLKIMISKPTAWVKAATGWHSTLEDSDLSKFINDLLHFRRILSFPFAFVLSQTGNVCAINIEAWCPQENANEFRSLLESKDSAPKYSGF